MKTTKVEGTNKKHKVLIYAISTCPWCQKTKRFLKNNGVEFEYLDIDLCSQEDREEARTDLQKRGAPLSYPALIIDGKVVITGYHEDKIKEALEI